MKSQRLRQAIDDLAAMPGMAGCAVVEIATGMVWHGAGEIREIAEYAEAASDYWRLSDRLNRHFSLLGPLSVALMVHANGRITMLPCGTGMIMVGITMDKALVDWAAWQKKVSELSSLVDSL
jgi:hypothetical protein